MESAVCPTPNIQQTLGCGGQETCEHIKDCRWVGRTKGIGICDTGFLKRTSILRPKACGSFHRCLLFVPFAGLSIAEVTTHEKCADHAYWYAATAQRFGVQLTRARSTD